MFNKSNFGALIVCGLLGACGRHGQNMKNKALYTGIERTHRLAMETCNRLYLDLAAEQHKPMHRYQAYSWISIATAIRTQTDGMNAYIDKLRPDIANINATIEGNLLDSVRRYEKALLEVFNSSKSLSDQASMELADLYKSLPLKSDTAIRGDDPQMTRPLLGVLQCDIDATAFLLLHFCYVSATGIVESFDRDDFVISQSSSNVQSGELITIKAGVGSFSVRSKPRFMIGGKAVKANDESATVSYTFKASERPGKHFIPVQIDYYRPDGSMASTEKKVVYTVVPYCR